MRSPLLLHAGKSKKYTVYLVMSLVFLSFKLGLYNSKTCLILTISVSMKMFEKESFYCTVSYYINYVCLILKSSTCRTTFAVAVIGNQ